MTQKIIVSDTDNAHATTMKNNILAICPTAQVDIRLETFAASVTYAIDNGYHGISRSTTGLSDLRIVSDGKKAWDAGIWTVHAHGSNTNTELSDATYIGEIITTRAPSTSYGIGVEITDSGSTTQSDSTSKIAGVIAQILTNYPSMSLSDAREILRESSDSFNSGWNKNDGFGNLDFSNAINLSDPTHTLNSIYYSTMSISDSNVNFQFSKYTNDGIQININNTTPPSLSTSTTGSLIYSGSISTINYNHKIAGLKYFTYFAVSGSKTSRMESFSPILSGSLYYSPIVTISGGSNKVSFSGGVGKISFSGGGKIIFS